MCGNAVSLAYVDLITDLVKCGSAYAFLLKLSWYIRDMSRHIDKSNFFIEISTVG